MTKKPQTVEIAPGDTTFKSSQCQEWQKTDAAPPPAPNPGDLLGQLGSLIGPAVLGPSGG
jgi:predicted lipid-binding transport protein (Tim44 family)